MSRESVPWVLRSFPTRSFGRQGSALTRRGLRPPDPLWLSSFLRSGSATGGFPSQPGTPFLHFSAPKFVHQCKAIKNLPHCALFGPNHRPGHTLLQVLDRTPGNRRKNWMSTFCREALRSRQQEGQREPRLLHNPQGTAPGFQERVEVTSPFHALGFRLFQLCTGSPLRPSPEATRCQGWRRVAST